MKFTSKLDDFNSDLWGHHFIVPKEIGEKFVEGNNRRVLCTINGKHEFQCGLMPKKEIGFFINVNKEIRDKLQIKLGETIEVELKKDNSTYGLPVPEEFLELLYQDPEGSEVFHKLSMGKQRSLIYLIAKPKKSDTRLQKAIVILDFLKNNQGDLDFKLLNQAFKDASKYY